jgi:hypothetical protein
VILNSDGMVSAAGSTPEYSAISVLLSAKAPPDALAQVKATSSIPIILRGTGDPKPLDGRTPTSDRTSSVTCPISSWCGDSQPFFGGSLMRISGVSGSACSTGTSLYAGTYNYMSTDWHCSP